MDADQLRAVVEAIPRGALDELRATWAPPRAASRARRSGSTGG